MTRGSDKRQHELADSVRPSVPFPVRWMIVLATGLGVGAATSLLQAHLGAPWASLGNAASPWLVPAFAVGTLWRHPSRAALAGLMTCVLELLGYYATAHARGYGTSHSILLFWGACAILGGPVFGTAGWAWWRGPRHLKGLAASVLPASFLAEAAISYGWRLHYGSSAALFGALGAATVAVLGLHHQQHWSIVRWLPVTLAIGVVAELLLGVLYLQAF
jgi:hypothetical protein